MMAVTRTPFPRDWRLIGKFFVLSIFATALPFTLDTWGETRISSGLTAILNGTVPLSTKGHVSAECQQKYLCLYTGVLILDGQE
jgi:hypothetical protein